MMTEALSETLPAAARVAVLEAISKHTQDITLSDAVDSADSAAAGSPTNINARPAARNRRRQVLPSGTDLSPREPNGVRPPGGFSTQRQQKSYGVMPRLLTLR
jgi:hypothetical protein